MNNPNGMSNNSGMHLNSLNPEQKKRIAMILALKRMQQQGSSNALPNPAPPSLLKIGGPSSSGGYGGGTSF
jgi:hypothetical protein